MFNLEKLQAKEYWRVTDCVWCWHED